MGKYIPLDALLAVIEKFMYDANQEADIASTSECFDEKVADAKYQLCKCIKGKIASLEVKEIDLEKEMDKEWNKCEPIDEGMGLEIASIEHEQFDNIAKHFFELGLKVNQDVDLELIISWFDHIAQIADDRKTANGVVMVDWAALDEIKCLAKESSEFIKTHYKAQKGE